MPFPAAPILFGIARRYLFEKGLSALTGRAIRGAAFKRITNKKGDLVKIQLIDATGFQALLEFDDWMIEDVLQDVVEHAASRIVHPHATRRAPEDTGKLKISGKVLPAEFSKDRKRVFADVRFGWPGRLKDHYAVYQELGAGKKRAQNITLRDGTTKTKMVKPNQKYGRPALYENQRRIYALAEWVIRRRIDGEFIPRYRYSPTVRGMSSGFKKASFGPLRPRLKYANARRGRHLQLIGRLQQGEGINGKN